MEKLPGGLVLRLRLAVIIFVVLCTVRLVRLVLMIAGLVPVVTTFAIPEKHVHLVLLIAVPVLVTIIMISTVANRQAATGIVMAMSVLILLVTIIMISTVANRQVVFGTLTTTLVLIVVLKFMSSTVVNRQVVLGTITATIVTATIN